VLNQRTLKENNLNCVISWRYDDKIPIEVLLKPPLVVPLMYLYIYCLSVCVRVRARVCLGVCVCWPMFPFHCFLDYVQYNFSLFSYEITSYRFGICPSNRNVHSSVSGPNISSNPRVSHSWKLSTSPLLVRTLYGVN